MTGEPVSDLARALVAEHDLRVERAKHAETQRQRDMAVRERDRYHGLMVSWRRRFDEAARDATMARLDRDAALRRLADAGVAT